MRGKVIDPKSVNSSGIKMSFRQHKRVKAYSNYRGSGAPARLNKRTGGFIGIEHKWFDSGITITTIPTGVATMIVDPVTPTNLKHLAGIPQGVTENNRVGRKVRLTSIHIKGYLHKPVVIDASPTVSEATSASSVRITLVLDTQTNGTQMSTGDCYQGHESNIATQGDGVGPGMEEGLFFRNLEHSARFRVLKDFKVEMNPSGLGGFTATLCNPSMVIPFEFELPLNVVMEFKNATGLIAACTTNSLHLTAIQYSAAVGPLNVNISYFCRVRFVG